MRKYISAQCMFLVEVEDLKRIEGITRSPHNLIFPVNIAIFFFFFSPLSLFSSVFKLPLEVGIGHFEINELTFSCNQVEL